MYETIALRSAYKQIYKDACIMANQTSHILITFNGLLYTAFIISSFFQLLDKPFPVHNISNFLLSNRLCQCHLVTGLLRYFSLFYATLIQLFVYKCMKLCNTFNFVFAHFVIAKKRRQIQHEHLFSILIAKFNGILFSITRLPDFNEQLS